MSNKFKYQLEDTTGLDIKALDMSRYKLICFDVDGTLCPMSESSFLPGVREWFATKRPAGVALALVTNQGGVGLREWMIQGNWGQPENYPTAFEVENRLQFITHELGIKADVTIHVCYAYQSPKTNEISPAPKGQGNLKEWDIRRRKPSALMVMEAMKYAFKADYSRRLASQVLFVGDSLDDVDCAKSAEVDFILADAFFGREAK